MSDISKWDPDAIGNSDAPPDGSPEGMPAGLLNDSLREVMAAVRRQWEEQSWFDWGDQITWSSFVNPVFTFTVPLPDATGRYQVGRRLRFVGIITGTVYGVIKTSVLSAVTTVTVDIDSGTVANESLTVSLGLGSVGSPSGAGPQIEVGMQFLCKMAALPTNGLWTLSVGDNDRVPLISDNFGEAQGGSWVISGIVSAVIPSHVLTINEMPSHNHAAANQFTGNQGGTGSAASGGPVATGLSGGGAGHTHTAPAISQAGTWRPLNIQMVVLEYTG